MTFQRNEVGYWRYGRKTSGKGKGGGTARKIKYTTKGA